MSHGRCYVFSNKELTENELREIFAQVEMEKVPNPYDYMTRIDDVNFEYSEFMKLHPELKHSGTRFNVTLSDLFDDSPLFKPSDSEVVNYLRALYGFRYGSWSSETFLLVEKYDSEEFEWTFGITLFEALIVFHHWGEMYDSQKSDINPLNMKEEYELILSDVYDYHY